jgi:hypothetical protein
VKLRFILVACFEGLDNPREGLIVDMNGFDEFGKFVSQILFTHKRFPALALETRTPVIDIAASALLDMLLRRKGTATMTTGHQPGIGKSVFPLSGLMQAMERGLCGIKEFSGDERFVYALIQLPVPAEIPIVDRVLQDLFQGSRSERLSGLAVGDALFIGQVRQAAE